MGLQMEHFYTCRGRQRAVFLRPGARFGLEVMAGDEAGLEVCFDPEDVVRRGQGVWLPFECGGGEVPGAVAVRVNIARVEGWVRLGIRN